MTWQDLEGLPLCLLTSNAQNCRIINASFHRARVQPTVVVETDSILALYTHVKCAGFSSVVQHSLLGPFALDDDDVYPIPIMPALLHSVGLVGINHDSMPPLQSIAWRIASTIDMALELNRRVPRCRASGVVK